MPVPNLPPTPDDHFWLTDVPLISAKLQDGMAVVTWQDGVKSRYHGIWLRDNCADPSSTDPVSHEQLFELDNLPDDLAIARVAVSPNGALEVAWHPDGHVSQYHPGWLRAHDYSNGARPVFDPEPEIWETPNFPLPNVTGVAFMDDDTAVLDALEAVARTGLCVVSDLATAPGTVAEVGARIGPLHSSHWGRVFDVKVVEDAASTAYTALPLPAHSDFPNMEAPPGLQILHCLNTPPAGGESVMIDGLAIARDMRRDHPEDFDLLCEVDWEYFNRAGGAVDVRHATPVFVQNNAGEVREVRSAPFMRAPLICDFDMIEPAYRAFRRFVAALNDTRYRMIIPFRPGLAILFDNRRILHSRLGFDPVVGRMRHLQGCYLLKDAWMSRRRAIIRAQTKLQAKAAQ